MSLSLAIAVNAIAGLALVSLLAYVMSSATYLRPHVPRLRAVPAEQPQEAQRVRELSPLAAA